MWPHRLFLSLTDSTIMDDSFHGGSLGCVCVLLDLKCHCLVRLLQSPHCGKGIKKSVEQNNLGSVISILLLLKALLIEKKGPVACASDGENSRVQSKDLTEV